MEELTFRHAVAWFEALDAQLEPQPATDWRGPIDLPGPVAEMYRELGLVDVWVPGYGNDYEIPSLARLWDLQDGYRTHGLTGAPLPDWPDELLVVAHQGGDPIAIHRSTYDIHVAEHGAGRWDFTVLAGSLVELVIGLGILGLVHEQAGADLLDEAYRVRQSHGEAAVTAMADLIGRPTAERLARWAEWTSG